MLSLSFFCPKGHSFLPQKSTVLVIGLLSCAKASECESIIFVRSSLCFSPFHFPQHLIHFLRVMWERISVAKQNDHGFFPDSRQYRDDSVTKWIREQGWWVNKTERVWVWEGLHVQQNAEKRQKTAFFFFFTSFDIKMYIDIHNILVPYGLSNL